MSNRTHIRTKHFQLPLTMREQAMKNIEDDRDPKEFLEVVASADATASMSVGDGGTLDDSSMMEIKLEPQSIAASASPAGSSSLRSSRQSKTPASNNNNSSNSNNNISRRRQSIWRQSSNSSSSSGRRSSHQQQHQLSIRSSPRNGGGRQS